MGARRIDRACSRLPLLLVPDLTRYVSVFPQLLRVCSRGDSQTRLCTRRLVGDAAFVSLSSAASRWGGPSRLGSADGKKSFSGSAPFIGDSGGVPSMARLSVRFYSTLGDKSEKHEK